MPVAAIKSRAQDDRVPVTPKRTEESNIGKRLGIYLGECLRPVHPVKQRGRGEGTRLQLWPFVLAATLAYHCKIARRGIVETPIIQLIAYVSLTLASVIVASVSLFFAFRQNFGWKPILLITGHGWAGRGEYPDHYFATIDFEFWNRRKYPIVIRGTKVFFKDIKLEEPHPGYRHPEGWSIYQSRVAIFDGYIRLEPHSHHEVKLRMPFRRRELDDIRDDIRVLITYFDPRTEYDNNVEATRKYQFNWGKRSVDSDGMVTFSS